MKRILVFLAVVATAAGAFKPGLRVKFAVGLDPSAGEDYFFNVPKTVAEAKTDGWKMTRRPRGPLPELVMYCPQDKVVCALFDDTDYVAGLQVALAKGEFTENVFDWTKRGFTSWNTAVEGQCKLFWTLQQYFVDEEYLSASRAERLAARERDPDNLLQAGGVWLTGTDKQLLKVSTVADDIEKENVFTKQAFIPWMGRHWYYNMTTSTECVADQMYSWFALTNDGQLTATAFVTFGQLELRDGYRNWFERSGELIVRYTVPNAPSCLYEYSSSPGAITMHIYYIDEPWTILADEM